MNFHGGLRTPDGQHHGQTNAPVMLLHRSADTVSGMEDLASLINQLKDASVPHDAQIFGGAWHSFMVQGSRDYYAQTDQKSWDALQRFLIRLN